MKETDDDTHELLNRRMTLSQNYWKYLLAIKKSAKNQDKNLQKIFFESVVALFWPFAYILQL